MKVLTVLLEKHHFFGLAGLINSVVRQGAYVDKFIIGYRGELPAWLPSLKPTERGQFCTLHCGLQMEFIFLEGNMHMVHERPRWFKHIMEVLEPDAEEFFYFDTDIIVTKRMSFFGEWVKQGVAFCEDVNNEMGLDHPIRKQWVQMALDKGLPVKNGYINRYFNAGFLGWKRSDIGFINDWIHCFSILSTQGGDLKFARVKDRTYPVMFTDQDSFNLAAMVTNTPISTMGQEAMGFQYGLTVMSHAVGKYKPWNRKFISDFFKGQPPRNADIIFWKKCVWETTTALHFILRKKKT